MRDEASDMTDEALDAEIARRVAVDPSPAFVAAIRQRAAADDIAPRWPLWSMSRLAVAGVVVAAAVAAVIGWRLQPRLETARSATSAPPPLAVHALRVSRVPAIAPDVGASGADRVSESGVSAQAAPIVGERPPQRTASTATAAHSTPEVLIDPRDARAMRDLLDGVAQHRIDLAPLFAAAAPPVMDFGPMSDIDIAPIDVMPLAGGPQGVSQ